MSASHDWRKEQKAERFESIIEWKYAFIHAPQVLCRPRDCLRAAAWEPLLCRWLHDKTPPNACQALFGTGVPGCREAMEIIPSKRLWTVGAGRCFPVPSGQWWPVSQGIVGCNLQRSETGDLIILGKRKMPFVI